MRRSDLAEAQSRKRVDLERWRFFHGTARSRTRRALLPLFAAGAALLRGAGLPPSLCLPYLNLLFHKLPAATPVA